MVWKQTWNIIRFHARQPDQQLVTSNCKLPVCPWKTQKSQLPGSTTVDFEGLLFQNLQVASVSLVNPEEPVAEISNQRLFSVILSNLDRLRSINDR